MVKPAAILFDLGGTVLIENSYDLYPGIQLLLELSFVSDSDLSDNVAFTTRSLKQEIEKCYGSGSDEFSFIEWLRLQAFSNIQSQVDLHQLEWDIWQQTVSLSPMPQIRETLLELFDDGIPIVGVSNTIFSAFSLQSELAKHGLKSFFQFIVSSADHGKRKPDASIFESVLEQLDLSASDVWFVGNSWEADVMGASSVGMMPIWLSSSDRSDNDQPIQHYRVSGWLEFLKLYRSIQ